MKVKVMRFKVSYDLYENGKHIKVNDITDEVTINRVEKFYNPYTELKYIKLPFKINGKYTIRNMNDVKNLKIVQFEDEIEIKEIK